MNKNRSPRKSLLINAVGFAAVLGLDFNEAYWFVNIFLALFIAANIVLYVLWPRLGDCLSFPMDILAAVMAVVTGYDYLMRGSQQVYLVWFGLGAVLLIKALLSRRKRRGSDPAPADTT